MDDDAIDTEGLVAWLAEAVDPAISSATVTKLAGGHSSGAWRVDVGGGHDLPPLVLKAPEGDSVVFRRDAAREARIIDAAGRAGAPVPAVVAVDAGGDAIGRPCFVMELVGGRSPADSSAAGYHDDPWLHEIGADAQRCAWEGFYDALGALHSIDASAITDASHGPEGLVDVLGYWRAALLDVAPAGTVPRQLALLDWLAANLPPGADDDVALCMGDARFVNCLIDGAEVRALVDFEVAYLGNPAADVGVQHFVETMQRQSATNPLPGIGDAADGLGQVVAGVRPGRERPRLLDGVRRDGHRRDRQPGHGPVGSRRVEPRVRQPARRCLGGRRGRGAGPMSDARPLTAADERVHPVDPAAWSWSESWFFSWIDLDGGPAGFFRVGVLPNQGRAMLWSFLHVDGQWLGVEESRLAFDDLVLTDGVAYDKWGLRFGWRPDPPLEGAHFTFEADALVRSGADAGAYVPVSVDLRCSATGSAVRTGSGDDDRRSAHETGRLEQPLEATRHRSSWAVGATRSRPAPTATGRGAPASGARCSPSGISRRRAASCTSSLGRFPASGWRSSGTVRTSGT